MEKEKTKSQLDNVNIVDFCKYLGIDEFKKHGRTRYKLATHDSLVITNHLFIWNSRNIRGNVYKFMDVLYGYKTEEVTKKILEYRKDIELGKWKVEDNYQNIGNKNYDFKPIEVTKYGQDKELINNYLVETRKLDKEMIDRLVDNKFIFTDEKNNIRFAIRDEKNRVRGYDITGTGTTKFKANDSGNYGFNIGIGNVPLEESKNGNLYIFESTIDGLSYLGQRKEEFFEKAKNGDYPATMLSCSGVRMDILDNFLESVPKDSVSKLIVCTDNDLGGHNFYEEIKNKYGKQYIIEREVPKNKDFNEDLVEAKKFLEEYRKIIFNDSFTINEEGAIKEIVDEHMKEKENTKSNETKSDKENEKIVYKKGTNGNYFKNMETNESIPEMYMYYGNKLRITLDGAKRLFSGKDLIVTLKNKYGNKYKDTVKLDKNEKGYTVLVKSNKKMER